MSAVNSEQQIWSWLADVPDPEIPVLSVVDLGIVRKVHVADAGVVVEVSPTYSGCPATEVIEDSIVSKLRDEGVLAVSVKRVLSPPWTTDWITDSGRDKLREYGIAPPVGSASNDKLREYGIAPPVGSASKRELLGKGAVHCPQCGSNQTTVISEFGSTACKASYKCDECLEPFEYFKCI
jgi:ring-1,2-phenylacetyl-CoA epoxidase subunit PaaD